MFADLVAWLESQLDAAELDASAEHERGCRLNKTRDGDPADPDLCDCQVHDRLLDVGARRRLLDDYQVASDLDGDCYAAGLERAVRDLALGYVDRSGYKPEWRP